MKKIAIIGAGNMGGAIARGLAASEAIENYHIVVSNRSTEKLKQIQQDYPVIEITTDNQKAVEQADFIILAVKPWLIEEIARELTYTEKQVVCSVAAGISLETLSHSIETAQAIYRVMPNTAISKRESMTLISSLYSSEQTDEELLALFNQLGVAMLIPETQMAAATALTSCGIAFVMKYIQAAMQAGVEMGIRPKEAQLMAAQCVKGASCLLEERAAHPSVEIDKVTTPGGLTIKGINVLEHEGFSSAIIKAIESAR